MFLGQLSSNWSVWLSYTSGNKNTQSYNNNLIKLTNINTWQDFGYFWTHSSIAQPSNFFADPNTGKYTKYDIEQESRKIESINFFKNNIEPTWQYGDNNKGGYFNFSIHKDCQDVQKIYQSIIFMAIGNSLTLCDKINGIRLIDTAAKNQYRCRIQIWVNFKQCQENLQQLNQYSKQISSFFNQAGINAKQLRFFNIDTDRKKSVIDSNPKINGNNYKNNMKNYEYIQKVTTRQEK